MAFVGADTGQLRELADLMAKSANELTGDLIPTISGRLSSSPWQGPDRQQFDHRWNSQLIHQIRNAATALDEAAKVARKNADDQDRTSDNYDGPLRNSGSGSPQGRSTLTSAEILEMLKRDPQLNKLLADLKSVGDHAIDVLKKLFIDPFQPREFTPRDTPNDIRGHMQELAGMKPNSDGIRVQKILCTDGEIRYAVYIDGSGSTKDGPWGGRLGWEDNIPGAASWDTKTLDSIRAQIAEEIDDPDAEVALFGFSQGGMVAQRLADESNGNIKTVVTYGSPSIQEYRNYGGADVLRVNHNADPTPLVSCSRGIS